MIRNGVKVSAFTFGFTAVAVWLSGGPLLSGASLGLKYGLSLGGTLAGMYMANAIYKSVNASRKKAHMLYSVVAFLMLAASCALILSSRMYYRNKEAYGDPEIVVYFIGLFFLAVLISGITFYGGKARNIF